MDPLSLNVLGPQQLVQSKLNKIDSGKPENIEGVDGEFINALALDLSDEELLELTKKWEAESASYESRIKPRQEANKTYYLGKQLSGSNLTTQDTPIAANLLFEAEETFLPAALSKNPEPVVWSDNSPEGNKLATDVKTMLQYHADIQVLRRKLSLMVRHWSIYFLGAIKHGWDRVVNDIMSEVIIPDKLVLDPKGAIDPYGDYTGDYLGERKEITAKKLIELFPQHEAYISMMVESKLGTNVIYTEWWTDEYYFYTFKEKVLDKNKNPYFNHPTQQPMLGPDGQPELDATGAPVLTEVKGSNHFARPKMPYTFLSVFSLGQQPHDITSLIEQNIPNQNLVTQRTAQIHKNLNVSNNAIALSEANFNQQTGKQAGTALERGNPVLVPRGLPIDQAIKRIDAPGYPSAAFDSLEIAKRDLRSIFGTEGISSQPPTPDTTARGMILNQQFDNTRIGGGIGDALEQTADNVFNWWVQLYYVFYDEPHYAAIMGKMKAVEYITLSTQDLNRRLVVSVSPDSLKPKDEITEVNQAIEFFQMGAIGPKTLLTIANFPDPEMSAADGVLYKANPQLYLQLNFPELAQQLQQAAMQQMQLAQATQGGQQGALPAPQSSAQQGAQPTAPPEPPTLSTPPASPALANVPLPK